MSYCDNLVGSCNFENQGCKITDKEQNNGDVEQKLVPVLLSCHLVDDHLSLISFNVRFLYLIICTHDYVSLVS